MRREAAFTPTDVRAMRRALQLARRGAGQVAPNPMVGAVIVDRAGRIVGEGFHARYGEAHAEVVALRAAGERAKGSTIYVTLEPCNHHGKTPPCTAAIIEAGIARVVFAVADPNPVASGGAAMLESHGIAVQHGLLHDDAIELNAAFLFAARNASRPWVTVKLATSIDGALVDASRGRGWLTGERARRAVHDMRASVDAIAVGIGTARGDDPLLTVRGIVAPRIAPLRIVFDRNACLPLASALVQTAADFPTLVITSGSDLDAEQRLRDRGVEVLAAQSLEAALKALRDRGVRHLLVEGGAGLASAFLNAGLVDRLVIFQAPVILGAGALPAFAELPARVADTAPRLRVVSRRVLGNDLMTTYAVSGE